MTQESEDQNKINNFLKTVLLDLLRRKGEILSIADFFSKYEEPMQ